MTAPDVAMMALAEAVDGIYMPKRMMVYANADDDVCRSGRQHLSKQMSEHAEAGESVIRVR